MSPVRQHVNTVQALPQRDTGSVVGWNKFNWQCPIWEKRLLSSLCYHLLFHYGTSQWSLGPGRKVNDLFSLRNFLVISTKANFNFPGSAGRMLAFYDNHAIDAARIKVQLRSIFISNWGHVMGFVAIANSADYQPLAALPPFIFITGEPQIDLHDRSKSRRCKVTGETRLLAADMIRFVPFQSESNVHNWTDLMCSLCRQQRCYLDWRLTLRNNTV